MANQAKVLQTAAGWQHRPLCTSHRTRMYNRFFPCLQPHWIRATTQVTLSCLRVRGLRDLRPAMSWWSQEIRQAAGGQWAVVLVDSWKAWRVYLLQPKFCLGSAKAAFTTDFAAAAASPVWRSLLTNLVLLRSSQDLQEWRFDLQPRERGHLKQRTLLRLGPSLSAKRLADMIRALLLLSTSKTPSQAKTIASPL